MPRTMNAAASSQKGRKPTAGNAARRVLVKAGPDEPTQQPHQAIQPARADPIQQPVQNAFIPVPGSLINQSRMSDVETHQIRHVPPPLVNRMNPMAQPSSNVTSTQQAPEVQPVAAREAQSLMPPPTVPYSSAQPAGSRNTQTVPGIGAPDPQRAQMAICPDFPAIVPRGTASAGLSGGAMPQMAMPASAARIAQPQQILVPRQPDRGDQATQMMVGTGHSAMPSGRVPPDAGPTGHAAFQTATPAPAAYYWQPQGGRKAPQPQSSKQSTQMLLPQDGASTDFDDAPPRMGLSGHAVPRPAMSGPEVYYWQPRSERKQSQPAVLDNVPRTKRIKINSRATDAAGASVEPGNAFFSRPQANGAPRARAYGFEVEQEDTDGFESDSDDEDLIPTARNYSRSPPDNDTVDPAAMSVVQAGVVEKQQSERATPGSQASTLSSAIMQLPARSNELPDAIDAESEVDLDEWSFEQGSAPHKVVYFEDICPAPVPFMCSVCHGLQGNHSGWCYLKPIDWATLDDL